MRLRVAIFLTIAALALFFWQRTTDRASSILIESPAATMHGEQLAVTLTIRNTGAPDRLLAASSPETKTAMLMAPDGGARGAPVPGPGVVSLSMDGGHVMLGSLEGDLSEGRLIPVVLTFERAGEVPFKVRFAPAGSMMQHGTMGVPCDNAECPTLALRVEPDPEDGWTLHLSTTNFRFSRDLVDGPHVPGTGHAHLYVGGFKLGRLYETQAAIPPLPPGRHIVRVTLNSNDHRTYMSGDAPVTATTEIVVQ